MQSNCVCRLSPEEVTAECHRGRREKLVDHLGKEEGAKETVSGDLATFFHVQARDLAGQQDRGSNHSEFAVRGPASREALDLNRHILQVRRLLGRKKLCDSTRKENMLAGMGLCLLQAKQTKHDVGRR